MQRWLLRVASHPRHGGGHVARCRALAAALVAAGAEPLVWLDPGSDEAAGRFLASGLPCTEWPPSLAGWSGSVLDGYGFEAEATLLSALAPPLAVLDDFLEPPNGSALVINSAMHLSGTEVAGVPALLGPAFALIDCAFAALPGVDRTKPVSEILVSFGRLDRDNNTGLALAALSDLEASTRVTVLGSATSPHRTAVARAVATLGSQGRLVLDAPTSVPFLRDADVGIGAGGVSLMERMAAGVPSVTVIVADNQRLFVEGAARLCATIAAPPERTALSGAIRALVEDPLARASQSEAGRRTIDGRGPARVAARLMELVSGRHAV